MKAILLPVVLSLAAGAALASSKGLPADTPPLYREECASCHVAYPPALLGAADWKRLMEGLSRHFGSDAALDAASRRQIEDFLVDRAGNPDRLGDAGDPPRPSRTRWFLREHRGVPNPVWQRVPSPANCEACHTGAAQGRFGEHEIRYPGR